MILVLLKEMRILVDRFSDTCDEADTHVAFHAVHVKQLNPGNTVIMCYDIDILTIIEYSEI